MEHNAQRAQKEDIMAKNTQRSRYSTSRRSLLLKGLAVGGAGALGAGLLTNGVPAFAKERSSGITRGDVAILRFLAAIEILETDLWQQYNELGGIPDSEVPGGTASAPYVNTLQQLDSDMSQYIHDNTEDEISHFTFINAFLASIGADPVNLDHFRNIPCSKATGARSIPSHGTLPPVRPMVRAFTECGSWPHPICLCKVVDRRVVVTGIRTASW